MNLFDMLEAVTDVAYATGGPYTFMEIIIFVAAAALVWRRPAAGARVFAAIERAGGTVAQRPWRAILVVGVVAIGLRALVLPWVGIPSPLVHDEHSIWLQGQTLAAGRLANPTHPLWQHFETFYVNHVPAYASMYFPGRGAPLALGIATTGEPWVGVWASMVLLCMATTWMLQGWVTPGLALLGGLLVTVRFGVFSFWVNSYYGGALMALGAMLVIGALPRILARPGWLHGTVMGLGAAILMVSRPYEGALVCAPVAALLLWRFARPKAPGERPALVRVFVPGIACVAAGAALLVAHNLATTHEPLKTPYGLNRATYAAAPAFLVAAPVASAERGPPHFRAYFEDEAEPYERRQDSVMQVVRGLVGKIGYTWNFYVGFILLPAFLAGLWCIRRDAYLVATLAFFSLGYAVVTWNFPQYTAPLLPILMIVLMRGFGFLASGRGPRAAAAARWMPATTAVLLVGSMAVTAAAPELFLNTSPQAPCCKVAEPNLREQLGERLQALPGKDLVLVVNGPQNPTSFEMVNNGPDIDAANIVWAHRIDTARDEALMRYYPDRVVWNFEWAPETPEGFRISRHAPAPGTPLPSDTAVMGGAGDDAAEAAALAQGLKFRMPWPDPDRKKEREARREQP